MLGRSEECAVVAGVGVAVSAAWGRERREERRRLVRCRERFREPLAAAGLDVLEEARVSGTAASVVTSSWTGSGRSHAACPSKRTTTGGSSTGSVAGSTGGSQLDDGSQAEDGTPANDGTPAGQAAGAARGPATGCPGGRYIGGMGQYGHGGQAAVDDPGAVEAGVEGLCCWNACD